MRSISHASPRRLRTARRNATMLATMNDRQPDLERYVELRKQIAELEAELEALKPTLTDFVHDAGDKVRCGDFVFRTSVSRSWDYSADVASLQTQLRDKKREEVERGIATLKKETRFVMMSPVDKPPADTPAQPPPAATEETGTPIGAYPHSSFPYTLQSRLAKISVPSSA